jgi:Arc/MetJ-type ribon-helix-helix transcriptional regulator
MATVTITIPDEWQPLIEREMAAGGYASPDDLLQDALTQWLERRDTLAAVNQGIDEMKAGLGRPVEEFDREFREKNGLPPRP